MRRTWYESADLPASQTLSAPDETATFNVDGYDLWQMTITSASVNTNVQYVIQASMDGSNWDLIANEAGGTLISPAAIGTGGTVTDTTGTTSTFKFARSWGGAGEVLIARYIRCYFLAETGGTDATLAVSISAAAIEG